MKKSRRMVIGLLLAVSLIACLIPLSAITVSAAEMSKTGSAIMVGDDSNPALWLSMLLAAAIGLVGGIVFSRKK